MSRLAAVADAGFVHPAYGSRSLVDVLPAVAAALGVHDVLPAPQDGPLGPGLTLPPARSYVVFLVDGLGHELLTAHAEEAPFLAGLADQWAPGTAGVPSTTATSLTSLGTARSPGAHGVVGYTSRIPGTERLLNALQWDGTVDPVQWQPHPTAFERLSEAGVGVTLVNKREFAGSGLTVAGSRGVRYVGADRLGERFVAVAAASEGSPSLTYMYDGDLDWTGHGYGVDSPEWRAELAAIDASTQRLRDSLPHDVRLLVTADHGMVDPPTERRVDVADVPELREGIHVLGGEARFRHLYCRAGALEDVLATWHEVLGDRAAVLARDEAVELGWLGPLEDRVRPRVGDVVVACRDDHAILSSDDFPHESLLTGMHGSLTSAEMLVPMLIA